MLKLYTDKKELFDGCISKKIRPRKPEIELKKINNEDTPAAVLTFPHFNNNIKGVSIIPPPIPIKPEKKPIRVPKISDIK